MQRSKEALIKGQMRIRDGFLFFPRKINGSTRWLCYAVWSQVVKEEAVEFSDIDSSFPCLVWVDFRWIR